MRVPLSWLREFVDLPAGVTGREVGEKLVRTGLEVETVVEAGADIRGPVVVARVLSYEVEEHTNGKSIRWCSLDTGEDESRWVVCGAHNFVVGDLVVAVLPGAVLPGGFEISARKTYGHISDGMICSTRELGMGVDHTGILVLGKHEAKVGQDAVELLHLRDPAAVALTIKDEPAYGVQVDDPIGCSVFVARTVTGINPKAATPRWLQQRLVLAGMRPISIGVDVTNYVMLELGQPIHGYDKARLSGDIVVRRAKPGEKLVTLDDQTRELDPEDLLITDDSGPIGIAGVMGGASTEIGDSTADVVIEAAHFDAETIEHLKAVGVGLPYEREEDDKLLTVTAPSWRPDLRDPNDFAEEVIRLYGYDNVPSVLPPAPGGH